MMRSFRVGIILTWACLGSPLAAQIPDEFTNLRVLPEDISRRELTATMRGFAIGLGVRCTHCHVGEEGQPFSTYDFASDDKEAKRKARVMIRMVQAINEDHLASLPGRTAESPTVTCTTCHGGVARPEPIEAVLLRTAAEEGPDAVAERYAELREQYYGGRAYDFGEQPLIEAAGELLGQDDVPPAKAILSMTLEYFPNSVQAWYGLGNVYEAQDSTEAAIAAYQKVLSLAPDNPQATRRLRALGGG